mmetsp:Transcript_62038/g.145545  ORF Transcript_62038/g.145545 Transcript_62038/m.145545 type:complete len:335 (-) Transcript_62038:78-1082(-)
MDQPFAGIAMAGRRSKDLKGSESETREPESDRLSQPSVDDSLSLPGIALRLEQEDVETRFPHPVQLVDLAPEEAKRRGNELLSLLSEGDKAPDLPNLPPQPSWPPQPASWRKPDDFFESGKGASSSGPPSLQGPWTKRVETWDTPLETLGGYHSEPYPWEMSQWNKAQLASPSQTCPAMPVMPGYVPEESLRRELFPVLLEAAARAFGPGQTATVQLLADYSGYEVVLQGAAAAELRTREEALLQALGRELWPSLSDPYFDMDQQMEQPTIHLSPSWRLILWRSSEGEAADSRRCSSFARHGACPRGKACRWDHEIPQQTIGIVIKVTAARYAK